MKFKKILALGLATFAAVTFVACKDNEDNNGGNTGGNGETPVDLKEEKVEGKTYYVSPTGVMNNDGLSKDSATTLEGMVSKIRKGDGSWKEFPKESVNMDLLLELKELILKGGHELFNFYDKNLVDEAVETNGNPNHLVLKLNEATYNKLNNKCKQEGRNINQIIESLIYTYLNE